MNKAAQAYFQTKVSTTDQGQLLLLLYDGALRFLAQAREKMEAKDYAGKGILISKVIDILSELTNTLNLEKGGTLAENLNNLYFLCTTRLLQANLKMDVNQLESVVSILSGLRSAYAEIIETPEAKRASAQISARLNVDASLTQRAAVTVQNNVAPTSFGRMQARNAYGAQGPAASVGAQVPPSGIPAAGVQQAPQAVQSEQAGQSAPQMAQPATAQPTGQAPQGAQASTPSVSPSTLQASGQPAQAAQGGQTAQEAQSAKAIPFAHAPQAPASTPAVAPSAASPAQLSPSAPAGQQSTQQAVQHSQAQRQATPANAPNAASPTATAPVAPAAQKPAPAPTPKAPLAPKQGFGVSGFAYTKAFGK